ncbi:YdcH family protein [Sphingorhabdus sp.]|uniref:YdcH family protein n=1 Tax=Sphingorhabdus sp. TaxID=1902408 RepID=UPI003BB1DF75
MSDKYHELNREIHRIEAGVEASSDARAEDLKKERLVLLDEIAAMISQAKAGAK